MGIEPTLSAWEAEVLPLNYIRIYLLSQLLKFNTLHSIFQYILEKISPFLSLLNITLIKRPISLISSTLSTAFSTVQPGHPRQKPLFSIVFPTYSPHAGGKYHCYLVNIISFSNRYKQKATPFMLGVALELRHKKMANFGYFLVTALFLFVLLPRLSE